MAVCGGALLADLAPKPAHGEGWGGWWELQGHCPGAGRCH